jgi:integrase
LRNLGEIVGIEKRWPLGTKERLVLDVYLYIGLRRGDAAQLGKQHLRGGLVHLKTEKTETPTYVPIHPMLAKSIKACPSKGLAIIAKPDGSNYTKESLGNIFREAIEAAGIPVTKRIGREEGKKGYSVHGLRKASAIIAAESGATESELNAMFGWSGRPGTGAAGSHARLDRYRHQRRPCRVPGTPRAELCGVQAFTDFGIENLIELVRMYKESPELLKRWPPE